MTRRLFVCHATADIEATSELVDALENALSFSAGSLWTSSLPGYCADPNDMPALGAALAGSDVVLALVTETSVVDAQFHFQLGAAWALGAHTVVFLLDAAAREALPSALSDAPIMRGHEPSQWPELIGDLSVRLGLVPRPGASSPPLLRPSLSPPQTTTAPAAHHPAAPEPPSAATTPAHEAQAAADTSARVVATPHAAQGTDEARDLDAPGLTDPNAIQPVVASTSDDATTHEAAITSAALASAQSAATDSHDDASSTLAGATPSPSSSATHGTTATAPLALSAATDSHDDASSTLAGATPSPSSNATHGTTATAPLALSAATDSHDDASSTLAGPTASTPISAGDGTAVSSPLHAEATAALAYDAAQSAGAARDANADSTPAGATAAPPRDAAHGTAATGAVAHDAAQSAAAGRDADVKTLADATVSAAPEATQSAAALNTTPPSAAAGAESTTPARPRRADETPLPAAVAKIANASARPASAPTALQAASAQIAAAKAQQSTTPPPSKPLSVPPLPGARPTNVPPLPAGVPPLPAAVIVPPPPLPTTDQDDEPTTTPKAPIIVLSQVPETELETVAEPPKLEPKPQPRAAGSYPVVNAEPSYLDELRELEPKERTPPRYSYIDELETLDPDAYAAATSGFEALPEDDEEPETREQRRVPARDEAAQGEDDESSDSDVFARLPTCQMALEAGRAVSECLFNRDEISDFAKELDDPLGSLIESLGASWAELREEQDLDTWVAVTDHLLQNLPDEIRKLEEWYRVGFELATLHNLAGQLILDGSDAAAEQHWRSALERFLMRAERAEIGYENLGRVLGLLENLVGPSHERDLANIPRSLEELRRYAAGADIHTAA